MKRSGSSKPRVRVIWDEQNLDFLEANKTPKQKINEPKTPYHAPEAEDGLVSPSPTDESMPMADAVHAEAIRHALSEVASTSGAGSSSSSRPRGGMGCGWTSSEDEEAEEMMDRDDGACGIPYGSASSSGWPLGRERAEAAASAMEMIAGDIHGFESNGRRWSFEDQRRAHYDEYRKAKMLRVHAMSDDETEQMAADDGERHMGTGTGAGGSSGSCSRQSHQDHEASLSRRIGDSSS